MRIIEGINVDLINPFPANQIPRMYRWLRSYKTSVFIDGSPKTFDEFVEWMPRVLGRVVSYGVIDKYNICQIDHVAPMVGFVIFEPQSPINGYAHIASMRRSWNKRLMDEAALIGIEDVFHHIPSLLRVSAAIIPWNRAAREFAQRIGFQHEGRLRHMAIQNDRPIDLIHYGLTRELWEQMKLAALGDQPEPSADRPVEIIEGPLTVLGEGDSECQSQPLEV